MTDDPTAYLVLLWACACAVAIVLLLSGCEPEPVDCEADCGEASA